MMSSFCGTTADSCGTSGNCSGTTEETWPAVIDIIETLTLSSMLLHVRVFAVAFRFASGWCSEKSSTKSR